MDGKKEHIEFRLPAELESASGPALKEHSVGIPLQQAAKIGAYVMKQHLTGGKRYPLVLMLEPLFRCNLACAGCGKIDYPDEILNQRLSYAANAWTRSTNAARPPSPSPAASRCSIARCRRSCEGFLERDKFVILCTNALLLAKKIDQYKPHPELHLVDPSGRRQGDARQVGLPGRRL